MAEQATLREQLLERRERVQTTLKEVGPADDLVRLLKEVDSALKRIDGPAFGTCEACHEKVEDEMLQAHPLLQWCLCRLTPDQQDALQRDLDLASKIQWSLLPKEDLMHAGWLVHHRYRPAGPVSGDYCDVVTRDGEGGSLDFLVGDVSGKGVAAAFLMARLSAMFRSLIESEPPIEQMVGHANRLFAESAISSQYATLVSGRATAAGEMTICNAGHHPPVVIRGDSVEPIDATGFPVGLFSSSPYTVSRLNLDPGDLLVLYTDGLVEARDRNDREYGAGRLHRVLREKRSLAPRRLAAACLQDLSAFLSGRPPSDDLTLMILKREE